MLSKAFFRAKDDESEDSDASLLNQSEEGYIALFLIPKWKFY